MFKFVITTLTVIGLVAAASVLVYLGAYLRGAGLAAGAGL